jgi:hypothetical protein
MMSDEEYHNLCYYCSKPCTPEDSVKILRPLGGVPNNPLVEKSHHHYCLVKALLSLEKFKDGVLEAVKGEFE